MDVVREMFEEASRIVNVYKDYKGEFLIYKGFKITKEEHNYRIQDARHSEFYSSVKSEEYEMMIDKGFIKAVDLISYKLNLERIEDYRDQIKELDLKKKVAKKHIKQNRRLNLKRIRLADENIVELKDQIQLSQSRIEQFKNKYNK